MEQRVAKKKQLSQPSAPKKKTFLKNLEEIYINELQVYLRRRMEMTFLPSKKIVESIYFWERIILSSL